MGKEGVGMALVLWFIVAVLIVGLTIKMAGGLASLVSSLLIGAVAGWLAGKYMRGRGFGILKNILVGIIGALIGGILLGLFGLHSVGIIGSVVTATTGSILILYLVRWVQAR
jgi:uncharacterized membrane protein YeaQ/YmgE (transglycosylase-associated protein family)